MKSRGGIFMLKQQKGISLIKLLIAIITLIILAGVTVYVLLAEDGLIRKATDNANEYKVMNMEL